MGMPWVRTALVEEVVGEVELFCPIGDVSRDFWLDLVGVHWGLRGCARGGRIRQGRSVYTTDEIAEQIARDGGARVPPTVGLTTDPAGPEFEMNENATMPKIVVTAKVDGLAAADASGLSYKWKATLVFNGHGTPHSNGRVIRHPDMSGTTQVNSFTIPFAGAGRRFGDFGGSDQGR